jgi:peptide/nickel transport system substrate-binding protein
VRATGARHRGGTLRVLRPLGPGPAKLSAANLDPAEGYAGWEILPLINDGLVAFRRTDGRRSATLVADIAEAVPVPTDGGRTYSFRLRRGVRYSTGAPVRASDIRHGLERVLRRGVLTSFYTGIRGARRCVARPAGCDLSPGIEVDDRAGTITFHLTAADPDFLYKLALPNAVAVPAGIGMGPLGGPLPATGPYMVAGLRAAGTLRLVRNPQFRPVDGRPDGYPDAIVMDFRPRADAAISAVQDGGADFVGGDFGLSGAVRARVATIAAHDGRRLRTIPRASTIYAFLNTRTPPFDNVDVRRALNYAVDRSRFVALKGGERFAEPTCQFLPSNFPGYRPYCPYTATAATAGPWTAPVPERARRLIARSRTRGMRVTVVGPASFLDGEARLLRDLLAGLGYRARLRLLPDNMDYFGYVADSRHRVQIGPAGWSADYPAPTGFLQALTCAAFVPGSRDQANYSAFCDRSVDRLLRRARGRPAGDPGAYALWADAERRIVDAAATVPLVNPKAVSLVSRRVGNYQYSQQWGVLYDQLWVR